MTSGILCETNSTPTLRSRTISRTRSSTCVAFCSSMLVVGSSNAMMRAPKAKERAMASDCRSAGLSVAAGVPAVVGKPMRSMSASTPSTTRRAFLRSARGGR